MKVRIIQSLNTPKGQIPEGAVIDLPGDLFEKLRGKVELISDSPFRGAVEIVLPDGSSFWLATEPESVPLIPEGMVFFTPDEIERLAIAGAEAARFALMIKQRFANAKVVDVTPTPKKMSMKGGK
jgi:hypothetical protein